MEPLKSGDKLCGGKLALEISEGRDDAFGEIWRARHEAHGAVLAICYCAPGAAELFAAGAEARALWTRLAEHTVPNLAHILGEEIDQRGFPVLLVRAPNGRSLRTQCASSAMEPREAARMALAGFKALALANTYELTQIGISPDSLFANPGHNDAPWLFVPTLPGASAARLAVGRYHAETPAGTPLDESHPDVVAMTWLWIEALAGDFSVLHEAKSVSAATPLPRLRTLLRNGITASSGLYPDPKLTLIGVERWIKHEADDDSREHREAIEAAGRAEWKNKLLGNRKLLTQLGIVTGVLVVALIALLLGPKLFKAENTRQTPYGAVNLYWEAMVARDLDRALSMAVGEATLQTPILLERITVMERAALASRFARALPRVAGDGDRRTVKVNLEGEAGDNFIEAEMTIAKGGDGAWTVEQLFFRELRTSENP